MSPDATVEWMQSHARQLRNEVGDEVARAAMDALIRDQKRPPHERREWLDYLFDGASSCPAPFAMTGEEVDGKTWSDDRLPQLVDEKNWGGVEGRMRAQGWPAEAVAEIIRQLTKAPQNGDRDSE